MKSNRFSFVLIFITILQGCSPLHIHESDSTPLKVAKVAARVPIAILSLGGSERWHYKAREIESWVGKSDYQLISAWGEPTRRYETGGGDSILEYDFTAYGNIPGTAQTNTYGTAYAIGVLFIAMHKATLHTYASGGVLFTG
jgi:hypothetical protein